MGYDYVEKIILQKYVFIHWIFVSFAWWCWAFPRGGARQGCCFSRQGKDGVLSGAAGQSSFFFLGQGIDVVVANNYLKDLASCNWSSGGSGLLQMIIQRIPPLTNDYPEDPASCKWSSGGSGLLQIIIQRFRQLANDHPEDLASYKWSSWGSGLLQMIIRRIRCLANDHSEDPASCKWSSSRSSHLQMIICLPHHPNYLSKDPESISRTFLEQFALVSDSLCRSSSLSATQIKEQLQERFSCDERKWIPRYLHVRPVDDSEYVHIQIS